MSTDESSAGNAEIMRLHYLEGLSVRAIARKLHVSRQTVRRRLGRLPHRADEKTGRRPSLLDPYEAMIQDWLLATPELKATQILERACRPMFHAGDTLKRASSALQKLFGDLRFASGTESVGDDRWASEGPDPNVATVTLGLHRHASLIRIHGARWTRVRCTRARRALRLCERASTACCCDRCTVACEDLRDSIQRQAVVRLPHHDACVHPGP